MISVKNLLRVTRIFTALAVVTVSLVTMNSSEAKAADGSQFDAGNIIDDALFYDGQAMSAGEVQNFLNQMVSTCRSGYTCLKDYRQDTSTKLAQSGKCTQYDGRANESAADIIYRVGSACGISQKVLIVLLQKEQSLITDTWPTSDQYRKATGYACPDTAACDATFNGFFNQVYMAALQYKRYQANPSGYNYVAGRTNNILYNPNSACGSSLVFIKNAATAGLYNYTPYQPNSAALGNLYGTGDSCSAYGNRNFWRMYTDWFGSTKASSLMRTVASAAVFLIGDGVKYPIYDYGTLSTYAALGPIAYVSKAYLDSIPTLQAANRIIRAPDGSIYFTDAGIKLLLPACSWVVDYGGSCSATGYMQLTTSQISKFVTGPSVSSILGTTSGKKYYVSSGIAHEILDSQSQAAAGINGQINVLTENALQGLASGAPIIRDSVVVYSRSGRGYLLANSVKYVLTGVDAFDLGLNRAASAGRLDDSSLSQVPDGGAFSGFVSAAGVTYAVTNGGLMQASGVFSGVGTSAVPVSAGFISMFPALGSGAGSVLKSYSSPAVYIESAGTLHSVESWEALMSLVPAGQPIGITTISDQAMTVLGKGAPLLKSGSLYREPNNPTVYMISGRGSKIAVGSFSFPAAIGITGFGYASQDSLDIYSTNPNMLTYKVQCGNRYYISSGGVLHELAQDKLLLYPFEGVGLDPAVCSRLVIGSAATSFVRGSDGAIYKLSNGQRLPLRTMSRYFELSNGEGWTQVDDPLLQFIPVGQDA